MKTKEVNSSYEIISLITKFKSQRLLKLIYEFKTGSKCTCTGYYIIATDMGLILSAEYNTNITCFITYQNIENIYIILSKDKIKINNNEDFIKSLKFIDIVFNDNNKKYSFTLKNSFENINTNIKLLDYASIVEYLNIKLNKNQIKYIKRYNN